MDFFNDLYLINKVIFKKTNKAYVKNLMLIPATWLYLLVYSSVVIILTTLSMNLGEAGGFIVGLAVWLMGCFVISDYLEHINSSLVQKKFTMSKIKTGGMIHFNQALAATAIPNIIIFILARLTGFGIPYSVVLLVYIAFATPEVVYQKQVDRLDIFKYGYKFFKENWKHWSIVNISLIAVAVLIYNFVLRRVVVIIANPIINVIAQLDITYQYASLLVIIISSFFAIAMISIPLHYIMIYRGFLFKVLSVSSRRKREYMRNIYGK